MDIPECAGLKEKYDNCFKNWRESCWREKTIKSLDCQDVFQDYKDCVSEGMRIKLEEKKKRREEGK